MWPSKEAPTRGLFVKEQVDALQAHGAIVEHLSIDGRRKKQNYLKLPWRVLRRVRSFRPDVVHAHYGLTGAMCVPIPFVPLVVTYHGSDVFTPWQRRFSQLAAWRADANVCVSHTLAKALGAPKMQVIPCGTDTDKFKPSDQGEARAKLGLPLDGPIVLFPGARTNPVKGYALFDEALRVLNKDQVHICELSGIARENVPLLMNAADALVVTSEYEGYCLAVTEALACGLPVLSVPVGSVNQRIDPIAGCHTVPRDAGRIAEVLHTVLDQGDRLHPTPRLVGFTQADTAQALLGLYASLQPG